MILGRLEYLLWRRIVCPLHFMS